MKTLCTVEQYFLIDDLMNETLAELPSSESIVLIVCFTHCYHFIILLFTRGEAASVF